MLPIKIRQFHVKKRTTEYFKNIKKSATSAQIDGRIPTDRSLYAGKVLKTLIKPIF